MEEIATFRLFNQISLADIYKINIITISSGI